MQALRAYSESRSSSFEFTWFESVNGSWGVYGCLYAEADGSLAGNLEAARLFAWRYGFLFGIDEREALRTPSVSTAALGTKHLVFPVSTATGHARLVFHFLPTGVLYQVTFHPA